MPKALQVTVGFTGCPRIMRVRLLHVRRSQGNICLCDVECGLLGRHKSQKWLTFRDDTSLRSECGMCPSGTTHVSEVVLTFRDDTSLRSDCGCALLRRHKSQKCSDGFMHYGTVFVGACYGCLREDGISPVVQVRVSGTPCLQVSLSTPSREDAD